MTTLLSEIFLFLVRAACYVRSMSYGPKHMLQWFSICHFVHNYTHNFKTKGCIRTFYLWKDCSTIKDIYSLGMSCMQVTISELWIPICMATTFLYDILCVLTLITRKTTGHMQRFCMLNDCSTIGHVYFLFRAGCEI